MSFRRGWQVLDEPEDAVSSIGALHAAVITALRDPESRLAPLVQVCRACTDLLPVDGASISFMTAAGHRETLYASDEVVNRIETLQFSLGEGPCFEAVETGRPVLVPDRTGAGRAGCPRRS